MDLGLLGLATPVYNQKYVGTFDAESLRDSSATKEALRQSVMSQGSIDSRVGGKALPSHHAVRPGDDGGQLSRSLVQELDAAFRQSKAEFNQREANANEEAANRGPSSLNRFGGQRSSLHGWQAGPGGPGKNPRSVSFLRQTDMSMDNEPSGSAKRQQELRHISAMDARKRSVHNAPVALAPLITRGQQFIMRNRKNSVVMKSKKQSVADQTLHHKLSKAGLAPRAKEAMTIDTGLQSFEELNMTYQTYAHQKQKYAAIQEQQASLPNRPRKQKVAQGTLPAINGPKLHDLNSFMISPLQHKRSSMYASNLGGSLAMMKGGPAAVKSPGLALPMLKPKRQSPMHQVQMERELGRHMMFDFSQKAIDAKEPVKGGQTTEEEVERVAGRNGAEDDGAAGKRKVLRVGMTLE